MGGAVSEREFLTDSQAADMIAQHRITRLIGVYPARFVFELGSGDHLTLWLGGEDHGDQWECGAP